MRAAAPSTLKQQTKEASTQQPLAQKNYLAAAVRKGPSTHQKHMDLSTMKAEQN
jgi:hypothetical protein